MGLQESGALLDHHRVRPVNVNDPEPAVINQRAPSETNTTEPLGVMLSFVPAIRWTDDVIGRTNTDPLLTVAEPVNNQLNTPSVSLTTS